MSTETMLNSISALCLAGGGIFFIYEGAVLVDLHKKNPERIPKKIAVAGALTILLGVLSLGFAALHYFFDNGDGGANTANAIAGNAKNTLKSGTNTSSINAGKNALRNTVANPSRNTAAAVANAINNARIGPTNTSRMNTNAPRF